MATESTSVIEPPTGLPDGVMAVADIPETAQESPPARRSNGVAASFSNRQPMPLELPDFAASAENGASTHGIDLLNDVQLHVTVELGRSRMNVEDVLRLGEGSIVELDKLAGDPVDVLVNERLVARGEVLVLNDTFSVRINEIVTQGNREG